MIIKTAKKGANKIICSQIRQRIGKKIKINQLRYFELIFLSERKSEKVKHKKIKISFLPNASSSAIGYKRNKGENNANI